MGSSGALRMALASSGGLSSMGPTPCPPLLPSALPKTLQRDLNQATKTQMQLIQPKAGWGGAGSSCSGFTVPFQAAVAPHVCSRGPTRAPGACAEDRAPRLAEARRGRELFLQCSSFSFRLLAALPSVIKIYQCEPKHLALHLLL